MAALAFKAIDYGAEQIPDKFFEKIPGGFFTPEEKKKNRAHRKKHQEDKRREEEPRHSRRNRSPQTDYSSYSDRESDYDKERRRRDRNRARSVSRGRDIRSKDLNGSLDDRDMAYAEQGQSAGPYFPPPPTSEHRPYHPQDYPSRPGQDEYRSSSAMPTYGYPPQPAATPQYSTQSPVRRHDGTSPPTVAYGEEAAHRYETIQNAKASQPQQPSSHTAARYTPGPGYAPSPVAMPQAPIPPPPVGVNSPPLGSSQPYAPYDPSQYASYNPAYPSNGNARASQPPFYRQHSRSQPSVVPDSNSLYPAYAPRSSEQVTQYDYPPSRRSSTKPERREHRHRARSADSRNDRNRENSRMSDMRGRFDDMDLQKKGLAAAVGGALAGGFAGRAMGKGKSRLTTLAGVAAGALGGQAIVNRSADRSRDSRRSPSRSRSRHRRRDDREKSRERSRSRGLRARSRSIVSRFRSKSRGRDDRDKASDRGSRRPDHGYEVHEEYDSFTESDSEGSPVRRHRRRTTKRKEY